MFEVKTALWRQQKDNTLGGGLAFVMLQQFLSFILGGLSLSFKAVISITCMFTVSQKYQTKFSRSGPFQGYRIRKKRVRNKNKLFIQAYGVVITGSTKGVGRALAEEFLKAGDQVVVCSRKNSSVDKTVRELNAQYKNVFGTVCNTAKPQDMVNLVQYAKKSLGDIDIWINNAGSNAYQHVPLAEAKDSDVIEVIETNMIGVLLGCKEAIKVMKDQEFGGDVFNMDGAGATGGATPRFAAYGATKMGLQQFQKSLEAELKMQNIDNVTVHNISPGMVVTDLLLAGADTGRGKFFINCMAEQPQTVAEFLVPRVREVADESHRNKGKSFNKYIKFLTNQRAYTNLLQRLLFQKSKDRWIKEN